MRDQLIEYIKENKPDSTPDLHSYRGMEMTYEQYCSNYESDPSFASLFGPPDDADLWNNIDKLTEHVKKLREHQASNWLGDLAKSLSINDAESRLQYLLSVQAVDTN